MLHRLAITVFNIEVSIDDDNTFLVRTGHGLAINNGDTLLLPQVIDIHERIVKKEVLE